MRLMMQAGMMAVALLGCSLPAATADLVTSLVANPTPVGDGFFAYTYDVQLSRGQLDATDGSTTAPTPLQFGTLYDFGPMASTNGTPDYAVTGLLSTSFVFSFSNTNTPTAYEANPTDDPNLMNVRFTYDGTMTIAPVGNSLDLGTFTVYSPSGSDTRFAAYDGQTYRTTNNTVQGNIGFVAVPSIDGAVATPEPSTLILAAAGVPALLGLGYRRYRRQRVA